MSRHTGAGTTFEGADYLGTNRVETNASQSVTGTRVYDAFGNLESTTGSPVGPFGYAGQNGYQGDPDSGLQLLGHRYYDSTTGRFLTRDPIQNGGNWYRYVGNNPVGYIDPTGLIWSFLKWLYTDDGYASDEIYTIAVDAAGSTLSGDPPAPMKFPVLNLIGHVALTFVVVLVPLPAIVKLPAGMAAAWYMNKVDGYPGLSGVPFLGGSAAGGGGGLVVKYAVFFMQGVAAE